MAETATADRLRELAREGYDAFTTQPRGDDTITVRKDDAPRWVEPIVHAAHGDMMPDDWRYEVIREAFGAIADSTSDDLDDPHDFADSTTDIYTSDLLRWVASRADRGSYVDEAREEFGDPRDFTHSLQMGQYAERAEVYAAVLQGLREVDTEYDELEDAE